MQATIQTTIAKGKNRNEKDKQTETIKTQHDSFTQITSSQQSRPARLLVARAPAITEIGHQK